MNFIGVLGKLSGSRNASHIHKKRAYDLGAYPVSASILQCARDVGAVLLRSGLILPDVMQLDRQAEEGSTITVLRLLTQRHAKVVFNCTH